MRTRTHPLPLVVVLTLLLSLIPAGLLGAGISAPPPRAPRAEAAPAEDPPAPRTNSEAFPPRIDTLSEAATPAFRDEADAFPVSPVAVNVGAAGGAVHVSGGLDLQVPAGAVSATTTITVQPLDPAQDPLARRGPAGRTVLRRFRLERGDGQSRFGQPLTLSYHYSRAELDGDSPFQLGLAFWDEPTQQWVSVPVEVDPLAATVTARIDHFSDWTTYKDTPPSDAYLPTVKDGQVDLSTGAASLSYPLQVPSGPLAPNLALSYHSETYARGSYKTQASWVGAGWSLSYYAIQKQDLPGGAAFSINLNGVAGELVQGTETTGLTETPGGWMFDHDYHTANQSYARIWHDPQNTGDPYDSVWYVRTTDGTLYTFGQQVTRCNTGTNTVYEVEEWLLSAVLDPNGNQAQYTYDLTDANPSTSCGGYGNVNHVRTVYPATIRWGPWPRDGQSDYYQVSFTTEPRVDYDAVNWRQQGTRRLKTVTVTRGSGALIRRYELGYYPLYSGSNPDPSTYQALFADLYKSGDSSTDAFKNADNTVGKSTLKSITPSGADGTSTLPATTFTYWNEGTNAYTGRPSFRRLQSSRNGYGGSVTYSYEEIPSYLGRYRVTQRTVADSCDPCDGTVGNGGASYSTTYVYGLPATNDRYTSADADPNLYQPRATAGAVFRGHNWVREVSPVGAVTEHRFALGDNFAGKEYLTATYPSSPGRSDLFSSSLASTDTGHWSYGATPSSPPNCGSGTPVCTGDVSPGGTASTGLRGAANQSGWLQRTGRVADAWEVAVRFQLSPTANAHLYLGQDGGPGRLLEVYANSSGIFYNWMDNGQWAPAATKLVDGAYVATTSTDNRVWYLLTLRVDHTAGAAELRRCVWDGGQPEPHRCREESQPTLVNSLGGVAFTKFSSYTGGGSWWFKAANLDQSLGSVVYLTDYRESVLGEVSSTHWADQSTSPGGTNHWSYHLPEIDHVYVAETARHSFLADGTTVSSKQTSTVDAYGNPATATDWGNWTNGTTDGDETYTENSYAYNPSRGAWIVDKAYQTTVKAGTTGGGPLLKQDQLFYDSQALGAAPLQGNVTTQRQADVRAGSISATYETVLAYDTYGNVTQMTNPAGSVTKASYETSYRLYPATVQQCLDGAACATNLTTTRTFDDRFGVTTGLTDPNGVGTAYQYDVFGRLTTTLVNGEATPTRERQYPSFGTPGSQHLLEITKFQQTNGGADQFLKTRTFFDGLGRVVEVHQQDSGSQEIRTFSTHDGADRPVAAYLPVGFGSQSSTVQGLGGMTAYTGYSYDFLGRTTDVRNPDNTHQTTSHGLRTQTVTDPLTHRTRQSQDARGRLVQVQEETSLNVWATTSYQYDLLGHRTQTTDAAGNVSTATSNSLGWKLSMTDPDLGSWSFTYDLDGKLHTQTDARGQTITFGYDGQRRLTSKSYSTGGGVTYTYDGGTGCYTKGRRSGMIDPSGDTTYCYDARGNLTQQSKRIDGVRFSASYSYDPRGKMLTETDPDNEVVTTGYDSHGRESSLAGSATYVSSTAYNSLSLPTSRAYGNGRTATATYYDTSSGTPNYRLKTLQVNDGGGGYLLNLASSYDGAGNLTQLLDNANGDVQTFGYDFRDRLISASGTSPSYSESYAYNAIGNLTAKAGVTYTYGDTAHKHAVTGRSNGDSYGYDANGNMTSRSEGSQGYTQGYDAENRLVSVTGAGSASFLYDGDGTLVKKTVAGVVTVHYFANWEVQNGTLIKYYLLGGKRVAMRQGCDLFYLHTDQLQSTSLVTKGDGTEQARQRYLPFGASRASSGSLPTDKRYTGQEYEAAIGLYNYGARFYAAGLARFLSADTQGVQDANPQTLNRYGYVLNNPLTYTDPTGHDPLSTEEKTRADWWIQARLFILVFGNSGVYDPIVSIDEDLFLENSLSGSAYRRVVMTKNQEKLGGREGFARAVDRLAGLYTAEETEDFVRATGTLFAGLSYRDPVMSLRFPPKFAAAVDVTPVFDTVGFGADIIDPYDPNDPANTHHYAAFLAVGYYYGRSLGNTGVLAEDAPWPFAGVEQDRNVGFRAVDHGDDLRRGAIRPYDLGQRIIGSL